MIDQAKVISFINLKGSVGKTTTAVNVAATLTDPTSEKLTGKPNQVLLIDPRFPEQCLPRLSYSGDFMYAKTPVN